MFATCAWAVIPVSLFEFWAARRGRPSSSLALAAFAIAMVSLTAAYFQAVYMKAALTSMSIEVGLKALGEECTALTAPVPFPDAIPLVYALQVMAAACMVGTLVRMPRRSGSVLI